MERLTYKDGNHYYFANDCLVEISTIDEDSLNTLQNVLDKLGAYEDAEEQGLLLRLPCKAGDTVYYIYQNSIKEMTIHHFEIASAVCIYACNFRGEWFLTENFGETLFITYEEAEAKLAEMEGRLKSVETGGRG